MTRFAARPSIAARLTLLLALIAIVVFAAVGALLHWFLQRELLRAEAAELAGTAEVVQHYIDEVANDGDLPDLKHHLDDALIGNKALRVWIIGQGGDVIYGGTRAPETHLEANDRLRIVREDGVAVTGLRHALKPGGTLPGAQMLVGLDTRGRERLMRTYDQATLLVCAFGVAATIALCVWATRRGLAPLHRLSQEAVEISPHALSSRLSAEHSSIELQPLVTSFNRVLDRVEDAYRQLEGFSADVAHELRTPLAILISGTELALSRPRPAEELKELLAVHLDDLRQLASMVNDMLFLAHADRGELATNVVDVSLRDEAGQVRNFLEASLAEGQHSLAIEGDARAAVNASLLRRALVNLVVNASRHTAAGQTIMIGLDQANGFARVSVSNPGEPIPAEVLPRMFERFARGDAARTGPSESHGLGLAIVRAIACMHGGETFAQSSKGQTVVGFTIGTVPRQQTPTQAPAER